MATYKSLQDKVRDLSKLLARKPQPKGIPQSVLNAGALAVDKIHKNLKPLFPPPPAEKREAKQHSISAQIVNFTTMPAERKKFFSAEYFKRKFKELPADKKRLGGAAPKTPAAIRDAIIIYYFWISKGAGPKKLKTFLTEIQDDYRNDPEAKRLQDFKDLHQELMGYDDVEKVVAVLTQNFPSSTDVKAFAAGITLRMPVQKRGQTLTVHERFAKKIHSQGEIARMDLDE